MKITGEEFENLAVYQSCIDDATEDPRYLNSPFLPLKKLSSKKKGARMEEILEETLKKMLYTVTPANNYDWDRNISEKRVEIKGSFMWENEEVFQWSQIRANDDYEYLAIMAFYPDRCEVYACTKAAAMEHLQIQDANGDWTHNQHNGKKVLTADTFSMRGVPADFPWMRPFEEVLPLP